MRKETTDRRGDKKSISYSVQLGTTFFSARENGRCACSSSLKCVCVCVRVCVVRLRYLSSKRETTVLV